MRRQLLAAGLPAPEVRAQSQAARKARKGTTTDKISGQEERSSAAAAAFVKADTFQGPRAGYAFQAGPQGTGYYPDK